MTNQPTHSTPLQQNFGASSNNYMSLTQQMSTKQRLRDLTNSYKKSCAGAHPSYETGYNPRHYNYLKNSSHMTNRNALNDYEQPNLMELTNQQRRRLDERRQV